MHPDAAAQTAPARTTHAAPAREAGAEHAAVAATPLAGPALVAGFATTISVWVAWWLTHLPTLAVPPAVATVAIGLAFVASLVAWTRVSPAPVRTGLAAGAVAGLLNLLILGSVLSVQAADATQMAEYANRFRDNAPAILLLYTSLTALLGVACGYAGRLTRVANPSRERGRWLARFGVVTVVSFFPLLMVGGAVTSTESGMAVPDSITSYGAFSALLPMSMMAEPRIFLEHTHRLLGTLVGLTTIALFLYTLAADRRKVAKIFTFALLVLVTTQGLLGAVRVDMASIGLAGTHGVLAQLVLAFAVITACKLSELDRHPPTAIADETAAAAKRGKGLAHAAAGTLVLQLILGAMTRHSTGSNHALWTHMGFAVVVVGLIVIAAAIMRTAEGETRPGRLLRQTGTLLIAVVFAQFLLGFLALWQVGLSGAARPIPTADELHLAHEIDYLEAIVTTGHQTTGALLLALMTVGVYWTKRITRLGAGKAQTPAMA